MATDFALSIVAPDRSIVEDRAVSVIAPGLEGYFGVMAGHVPMISALAPGLLEYVDRNNQRKYVSVNGGFVEVSATSVTVLADDAIAAEDINVSKAEEELETARKALQGDGTMSKEEAVMAIQRATQRIRAARSIR